MLLLVLLLFFQPPLEREAFEVRMRTEIIRDALLAPVSADTESGAQGAFWAISQFHVSDDSTEALLRPWLDAYPRLSTETRRGLLEAIYASFGARFIDRIAPILAIETDPKLIAMAVLYADRVGFADLGIDVPIDGHPIFEALADYRATLDPSLRSGHVPHPPLQDLFDFRAASGTITIYSMQHRNRDIPGYAMIQNADGSFVLDADGDTLRIPQLARAASNLPYFLTNGNTPQGLYKITGTDVSTNVFIGPTPNIQLVMNGESVGPTWDTRAELPPSWREYAPMLEADIAARIGRSEIIAHGTAVDPEYFRGKPYFPMTPTLGCLATKEIWDPETGQLLESGQEELIHAFLNAKGEPGFLIVIGNR
jgi:hypothetical protein